MLNNDTSCKENRPNIYKRDKSQSKKSIVNKNEECLAELNNHNPINLIMKNE